MSNFNISNVILKNVQYNFANPDRKSISISVNDTIEILEIDEKDALLKVVRELSLGPDTDSYVKISYEISVENEEVITKDIIREALCNKTIGLVGVFSKISLLMSQVTNLSPFGIIVTPPTVNLEKTNIL